MKKICMMRYRAAILVAAGLVGVPVFALRVDPRVYAGGRSRDAVARSARNASAFAVMLGELRTSISDILFVKTERYLHSGVAYVPHHEEQLLSVEEMGTEIEEHQSEVGLELLDEDHAGTPTLIPSADQDFRGFIGRMHREVKPWRDPDLAHLHTDGMQLLPWFRIMTLTDPHYIMGYTVGGWWVSHHDPESALAFLDEGVRHNAESFQIRMARGHILMRLFRLDPGNASLLERIRADFREAVHLGLAARPDAAYGAPEEQPGWSLFQEQDLWSATQTLVILERQHGDPQYARSLAAAFLRIFPDNPVLANIAESE